MPAPWRAHSAPRRNPTQPLTVQSQRSLHIATPLHEYTMQTSDQRPVFTDACSGHSRPNTRTKAPPDALDVFPRTVITGSRTPTAQLGVRIPVPKRAPGVRHEEFQKISAATGGTGDNCTTRNAPGPEEPQDWGRDCSM